MPYLISDSYFLDMLLYRYIILQCVKYAITKNKKFGRHKLAHTNFLFLVMALNLLQKIVYLYSNLDMACNYVLHIVYLPALCNYVILLIEH